MPSIDRRFGVPLDAVDLEQLRKTDPEAAALGEALNGPRGVNLDGNPKVLRRDEFVTAGNAEYALNPAARSALLRLDAAFWSARGQVLPVIETHPRPPSVTAPARPNVTSTKRSGALMGPSDLVPVQRGGLSMPGVMFVSPSGVQTSFVVRADTGEVFRSEARGHGPFSPSVKLPLLAFGAAGATIDGRDYLYTAEPDSNGASRFVRRAVLPNGLGAPENVVVEPTLPILHWPQMTTLSNGLVALAAATPGEHPWVGLSADGGRSFRLTPIGHSAKDEMTLAHVGGFSDGTLAVTTQVADAYGAVQAFVRTTRDGLHFSAPLRITDTNPNVHDAFVLQRVDGDVDLYYLKQENDGFAAWRRSFSLDGELGPEQRLTGPEVGPVEKPQARRLPDETIRLQFARRNHQSDFDVLAASLKEDAPRR